LRRWIDEASQAQRTLDEKMTVRDVRMVDDRVGNCDGSQSV